MKPKSKRKPLDVRTLKAVLRRLKRLANGAPGLAEIIVLDCHDHIKATLLKQARKGGGR